MSLLAVWTPHEDEPRVWMASDSRLSDEERILLDEGVKIFEVPIICRRPGASGDVDTVYFATSIGLGCVGGSLIYQQVHATLLPLLSNLIGLAVPSLADVVRFTAAVASRYVHSLGRRRPEAALHVQLIVAGYCPIAQRLLAYELRPQVEGASVVLAVQPIDLSEPYFAGDQLARARTLYTELAAADQPAAASSRAPLNVIRQLIDDDTVATIGGDVQVGFTVGPAFRRVQTLQPVPGEEPRAAFWLNAICVDDLPTVGPCGIGLMGSVSP